MGVLSTLYTVLGGIEAVIWTDVIQVVVLVGGAIAALAIIAQNLDGGLMQIFEVASAERKFQLVNLSWDWTTDSLGVILLGAIFANLVPYTTDQSVIQRYLTTRDERQAAAAIWTNGLMCVPASALFFLVGTALFVFFQSFPERLAPLEKADQIFPWFIAQQMPAGLAGLVIAGVFAAAMSSLDSSIHSISTAITTDFVRRFRPDKSEHELLNIARILTVILGLLGTATAMLMVGVEIKFLWDLFIGIVGLLGGTLCGLFMLGIFTRKTTSRHAWIGAVASALALIYTRYFTDLNGLVYAAVGTLSCFAVGVIASTVMPSGQKDLSALTIFDQRPADEASST
jgi:Na+/proline symporter